MPLWGNTDAANSKPLFPTQREVRPVALLTTANATTAGNTIIFNTAVPASVNVGMFVYAFPDANAALARLADGSIIDQNDIDFLRSNNTIKTITDAANGVVRLTNNVTGTLAGNVLIYIGSQIPYTVGRRQANTSNDTILVTATRMANSLIGAANTGNFNQGWNIVRKKTNNDGTTRYLRECLVALASPVASNASSANTSAGGIFSGV